MKNASWMACLAVLLSSVVACGGNAEEGSGTADQHLSGNGGEPGNADAPGNGGKPAPAPGPSNGCTPLGSKVGPGGANPAALYCIDLGFVADGGDCSFPDGTRCEQWAFWRGECGGAHSFCARQGGSIAAFTDTSAGWTAVYAVCTLPDGSSCKNADFAATCRCE